MIRVVTHNVILLTDDINEFIFRVKNRSETKENGGRQKFTTETIL